MKILVIASCSKKKSIQYPHQPTCNEIPSKESREQILLKFPMKKTAKDLYRGALNLSTNSAVRLLKNYFDISYYIVSAGFGLIDESVLLPPYDCSFSEMTKDKIIERAELLHIPEDFQKIITKENPDLIYLALGKDYLTALGKWDEKLPCKTIAFTHSDSTNVITLPADHITVKEVSQIGGLPIHGVIGFKGDLLLLTTRYLKEQQNPEKALRDLLDNPDDLIYTVNSLREHT
ncbi:MAG: DUF6884 domain-containing protein [Candidatus Heimdallarchaeota archaeon]